MRAIEIALALHADSERMTRPADMLTAEHEQLAPDYAAYLRRFGITAEQDQAWRRILATGSEGTS